MNNRETIEGVEGEWRTVTKADEVTVGQRVRFKNLIQDVWHYETLAYTTKRLMWNYVQAFFPIAKPVKRKRPSKHERLLKALLKAMQIDDCRLDGPALTNRGRRIHYLSTTVANQLIAIKQAMEKKGAK